VIRSHSNIFYVQIGEQTIECRPRGKLRLEKIDVLAGDQVEVTLERGEGRIDQVLPRQSFLERPAVANVDQAVVLFTLKEPEADYLFLDRVLVHAARAGVDAVVVLNKIDLAEPAEVEAFCRLYGIQAGYPVVPIAAKAGIGVESLLPLLAARVSVLAGHSGVGKSRLVRTLVPERQDVRVGELSEKMGRGKHTTRHTELIPLPGGGLLADSPGFTYLEFQDIVKWDLAKFFPEFAPFAPNCRFSDCLHDKEPDCAVRAAVECDTIARSRHHSYIAFLREVESLKRW
jgi:ribosome biogenesis GTPase